MSRPQALAVSLLLALAAASGAWAVSSTSALRGQATKPEVASAQALARRAKQLDVWEASLARALRSRPPALPALPRYAAPLSVRAAGAGSLPALVPAPRSTARNAQPTTRGRVAATAVVRAHVRPHTGGAVPAAVPVSDDPAPEAAPAAAPADAAPPAAAPRPAPAPAASAPQPPSVEQQCEQLKQAAEGQGEAAKRAAERQCEQLKQAADGQSGEGDGGHD